MGVKVNKPLPERAKGMCWAQTTEANLRAEREEPVLMCPEREFPDTPLSYPDHLNPVFCHPGPGPQAVFPEARADDTAGCTVNMGGGSTDTGCLVIPAFLFCYTQIGLRHS